MTTSNARRVRDFHDALGDDYPTTPTIPSPELLALRTRLIDEEHAEVIEAAQELADRRSSGASLEPSDLAPLAHELIDLLYVTYGALAALGIPADAAFDEVHRANMTKAGAPRRADGKVLKPEAFQPASLATVIANSSR